MSEVKPDQVQCDTEFPDHVSKIGEFANAFRIVKDTGEEFFLDFLVYSASENKAKMVTRVRVPKVLLPAVMQRLGSVMRDILGEPSDPALAPVPGEIIYNGSKAN